jgi:hypothetical protein
VIGLAWFVRCSSRKKYKTNFYLEKKYLAKKKAKKLEKGRKQWADISSDPDLEVIRITKLSSEAKATERLMFVSEKGFL